VGFSTVYQSATLTVSDDVEVELKEGLVTRERKMFVGVRMVIANRRKMRDRVLQDRIAGWATVVRLFVGLQGCCLILRNWFLPSSLFLLHKIRHLHLHRLRNLGHKKFHQWNLGEIQREWGPISEMFQYKPEKSQAVKEY
jgi:hypothetical protein